MALIYETQVYGFGSYFHGNSSYQDIDILVVHTSTDRTSCLDAIALKKSIIKQVEKAGVSILSESAELDFDFINKSKGILLHEFNGSHRESDLKKIENKIHFHREM
jgi:predicted nucleotidyltransferase